MITTDEARKMLALIEDSAPGLRAAGVRRVDLGGVAFELAPSEPEPALQTGGDEDKEDPTPTDVMRDPWTRGVPAGKDTPTIAPRKRKPI